MAERTVTIDGDDRQGIDDDATLDEIEYYQRLLPAREAPFEAGVTLLSSLAIVLGLAALWYWPVRTGALAIGLALVAIAFAAGSNRYPRIALSVATICWLLGSTLGVLLDRDVW
jgi:hypothetical protein